MHRFVIFTFDLETRIEVIAGLLCELSAWICICLYLFFVFDSCEQNFQLVSVPADQYGCFYDGDSYLILAVSQSVTCSGLYRCVLW